MFATHQRRQKGLQAPSATDGQDTAPVFGQAAALPAQRHRASFKQVPSRFRARLPQPKSDRLLEWQELLRQWTLQKDVPLLVRCPGVRGSEVDHESGRRIVICDNSPAVWACRLAVEGNTPTIAQVREWFERDEIPVAFAIKREEQNDTRFRCTLGLRARALPIVRPATRPRSCTTPQSARRNAIRDPARSTPQPCHPPRRLPRTRRSHRDLGVCAAEKPMRQ